MGAMTTVGICEDDDAVRSVIERALRGEGFEVRCAATGRGAVHAFAAQPPDLLVLDIGLPDSDGRDVCQALRSEGVAAPVIFLTARDALTDRLSGFHAGGDDYLTKPFALAELLVRVRALLRRSPADDGAAGNGLDVRLDPAAHALRIGEAVHPLTPTEFRLLAALAARAGEVVRRHELIAAAWPAGAVVHDNTLDAYIARLRRKLRAAHSEHEITTARGVGYSLR
jgi:two-component system, OmpR family, response regulator